MDIFEQRRQAIYARMRTHKPRSCELINPATLGKWGGKLLLAVCLAAAGGALLALWKRGVFFDGTLMANLITWVIVTVVMALAFYFLLCLYFSGDPGLGLETLVLHHVRGKDLPLCEAQESLVAEWAKTDPVFKECFLVWSTQLGRCLGCRDYDVMEQAWEGLQRVKYAFERAERERKEFEKMQASLSAPSKRLNEHGLVDELNTLLKARTLEQHTEPASSKEPGPRL